MVQIPVTYKCLSCGNQIVELEETDVPIPAREQWNLCPECQVAKNKPTKPEKPCFTCGGYRWWLREGYGPPEWLCARCHPKPLVTPLTIPQEKK